MQNLSQKELRYIGKNRNITGYKSMPKDKLLRIIDNNNNNNDDDDDDDRGDRKSLFKQKKGLYKPTRKNLFKLKREKIKKSLYKSARKNLFKSKIDEIKEILHDPITNRDEKIEEIKKILYDPRNNIFKLEKDHYKPVRIAFSSNCIEYKSKGDKDKSLSIKDYLGEIKPYLNDIINDYKTQSERKIYLTMAINFFCSKDFEETHTMYSESDNIEVMMGNETDKIIEDLFGSFSQKYQKDLEESMRGSEFVFDKFGSLYYKIYKINLNRGGSYIDSPKWLKNKKTTVNPKNNDDKYFQYAAAVALNHEQIKHHPERVSSIKPFIDQYNWKERNFPSNKRRLE